MKYFLHLISLSSSIVFYSLTLEIAVYGQISPDNTTPTNINSSGNLIEINGGTKTGSNLFHSFQQFSLGTAETAFFNNSETISNIISRVTGGNVSNIDGLIRANGSANLFLINPAGIVFGSNATLNIGGSFFGSTADSVVFPEGEFSVTNPQLPSTLIINAPIGLRFRDNPGTITNRSQASLDGAVNAFSVLYGIEAPAGLQTSPGQTLALIGGKINLENGNLTAPGGRIELGSVAGNSLVSITPVDRGFSLGYKQVSGFDNIKLSQFSLIDTSETTGITNSGAINIQGKQITLTDASNIFSINFSEEQGGDLTINASDAVRVIGDDSTILTLPLGNGAGSNILINTKKLSVSNGGGISSLPGLVASSGEIQINASDSVEVIGIRTDGQGPSSITIQPLPDPSFTGDGTNLTIETKKLLVRDGAQIGSLGFGDSQAANLTIKASDIQVIGTTPNGQSGSQILTQAETGTENAGNLTIETETLIAKDGGFISASTFGSGDGGDLTVSASKSITLSGTAPTADSVRGSSGLFALADEFSSGNGGNLSVTTEKLVIEDGAKISAETFGTGSAGNISLDVDRLIVRDGGQVRASFLLGSDDSNLERGAGGTLNINAKDSIEVTGTGNINGTTVKSSLLTLAEGTGKAGDLNLTTNQLTVTDGGEINASATGTGAAGNLKINANNINLDRGTIKATTSAGTGGNIELDTAENLIMRDNSQISAKATGEADGGNVKINSDFIVAFPNQNNDILASAEAGRGGNINIIANGVFGIEQRPLNPVTNDLNASSALGAQFDGVVEIITPDVDPFQETAETPENTVDSELVVAGVCNATNTLDGTQNTLVVKGKGGVPPLPTEPFDSEILVINGKATNLNTEEITSQKATVASTEIDIDRIIPAQGIVRTEDGQVLLVGYATPNSTPRYPQNSPNCGG